MCTCAHVHTHVNTQHSNMHANTIAHLPTHVNTCTQYKPGRMACVYNPSTGEMKTGGSLAHWSANITYLASPGIPVRDHVSKTK